MSDPIHEALKAVAISAACVMMLASCGEPSSTAEPGASVRMAEGDVVRIAVAPDGTVLWGVRHQGINIYFASSGTRRHVTCGKGCTRTIYVPTAAATEDAARE